MVYVISGLECRLTACLEIIRRMTISMRIVFKNGGLYIYDMANYGKPVASPMWPILTT
jgi:hypothetical protein